MINAEIAHSPSKLFYFIWNEEKIIFVLRKYSASLAAEMTAKYYASLIDSPNEKWRVASLHAAIEQTPKNVRNYLIDKILSALQQRDLIFGVDEFSPSDETHTALLRDAIFCVDKNLDSKCIEYVNAQNNYQNSIVIKNLLKTWKSEFTKKKTHMGKGDVIAHLSFNDIESFVANSEGIVARLKDGSYFSIGDSSHEYEYDSTLDSFNYFG